MFSPARYFPIEPGPLRMQPGLQRFGTSFGNGVADQRFFPWDVESPRYLAAKRQCLAQHPQRFGITSEPGAQAALQHVAAWMHGQWNTERKRDGLNVARLTPPGPAASHAELARFFRDLGLQLPEDFVIVQQPADGDDAIALHQVCFPSRWRPEHSLGASFRTIHAPVPEFEAVMRRAEAWVRALITKGPYVRFVWSLVPEATLDLHPEATRLTWTTAPRRAYLRVERQVSVPFAAQRACLFLIRVYVYPIQSLQDTQQRILATALREMPEPIRRYKGLERDWPAVLALLQPATTDTESSSHACVTGAPGSDTVSAD